jgi:hypothetical protein
MRASVTFDPANPNAPRTLTVTKTEKNKRGRTISSTEEVYTQGAAMGIFRDSNGDPWVGEYSGAGGKIRNMMGKAINDANVDDATIDAWGTHATGLKKKEKDGGGSGSGSDKGNVVQQASPRRSGGASRLDYGNLRYPLTMLDKTDFVKINMLKYQAGGFGGFNETSGKFSGVSRPSDRITQVLGSVILPIPPGLTDANTVSWGDHSMNAMQMGAANAASRAMTSETPFKQVGKEAGNVIEKLKKNSGDAGTLTRTMLLSQVSALGTSTNQFLARQTGQVLNPNLELLFGGPTLRSFTYNFKLTARSEKETRAIRSIIRFFKQGMSVKTGDTGLYLSSPHVFHVQFKDQFGKDHKFINKLKKTAMTGFNVNYVPDGTYMTLPNSAMTAYEIAMSFQELDPIYDEDYGDGYDEIGF